MDNYMVNGSGDDLSERKRRILQAVVEEYIATAEPVGSRAISKRQELGLSSATIRNEMADLEDMGYLMQPHTSAGRIPSDLGYRFYVNRLMQKYRIGMEVIEGLQQQLQSRITRLDRVIRTAGLAASLLTEYTTFITAPASEDAVINKTDIVPVGEGKAMLLIVTEKVRSRLVSIPLDAEQCAALAAALQEAFCGRTIADITEDAVRLAAPPGIDAAVIDRIAAVLCETAHESDGSEIFVQNTKSILSYPEYSNVGKAKEMLEFLENKEELKKLLIEADSTGGEDNSVRARIGAENSSEILNNCSLVTVNYTVDGRVAGKIGVIGPKRMNYAKVFASLDLISHEIENLMDQFEN